MWRAFFLAVGVFIVALGAESLLIERALWSTGQGAAVRQLTPPEWAPWSLLSAGAVVIIYSFTIPRRVRS